ncbi:hypothetical protein RAB80_016638 [Fusarium oxysporum f. sp. vasinfectum]|uniref:Uncharacterized protein n=1 Tax=Fusarium oxysporum f. sp. vasinfectum 25433 TaxID=1089449 RepID=X0L586_FUSOX|nr:hypothetical protein FOTG_15423 [Fusarium oxysporum f. sp. vasinfectum 25433]KAK2667447.1 hypothetical protein RAB80_016638 [Fusarium oxysporum f. sp. vasinfectum]KAK2931683.1 hypothetical protein FoTM2_009199 [Fusarium oxysporum f. sp. vasinfectum]
MAEESVTMLNIFGFKHTASLTTAEKFRLNRSFYLFRTVCNMFCTNVWPEDWQPYRDNCMLRFGHTPEEHLEVLSHYFSPWVNHQLLCVYRFLERNIVRSFDYLAENDIGYAGWSARYVYTDSSFIRCDELFTRGLFFHLMVYRTKGYEATSQLLKPPPDPEPRYGLDGVSDLFECSNDPLEVLVEEYQLWDIKIRDLTSEHLDLLSRPQGGEFDGLQSSPCHNWKCAWYDTNFNECHMTRFVSWLVECAYVVWDYSGIPDRLLSEKLKAMSDCQPLYAPRRGLSTTEDDIRSMDQRLDIHLRGGEGWCPTKGVDFSSVTGLTKQDKEGIAL